MLVGLDVGTSKIVAMIAEVLEDGKLNVIGVGQSPSRGLKRGQVQNIETTVNAIRRAVDEAELMADCKINHAYVGIAGAHIKSMNSHGMVAIKEDEVTKADIDRVIETARAVSIPPDHEILHVLTQEFSIDGQEGVNDPLGMSGVRLEAKVHIVTGATTSAQNISKCVRRCDLDVSDLVLQPMASAMAVLSDDERDLGVCLIDIGGGTTDIAVYVNGSIRHTAVIPIAGDQITNDIAQALRAPTKEAEEIKCQHGACLEDLVDPEDKIEVPGVGDRGSRQMARTMLAQVIEPRVEELFMLVQNELRRSGFDEVISGGVVLTGGSSLMPGMPELAEEVFRVPVRIGVPKATGMGGISDTIKNPRYSTALGLLIFGQEAQNKQGSREVSRSNDGGIGSIFSRMKNWISSNF